MALSSLTNKIRSALDGKTGGSPLGLQARDLLLGQRLDELASFQGGTATVPDGAAVITADVGEAYDGLPVLCTINGANAGAVYVVSAVWDGAGVLTIRVSADPGADLDIGYFVDGRGSVS